MAAVGTAVAALYTAVAADTTADTHHRSSSHSAVGHMCTHRHRHSSSHSVEVVEELRDNPRH